MDRKSFFKRVLFGIGAVIAPTAILKAIPKDNPVYCPPAIPYDDSTTLFWQMQAMFPLWKPLKTTEFYWAEYDSDEGFEVVKGPNIDPTPVTITLREKEKEY